MRCIKGHEIEILKSNTGFYVGTREDGFPYCRISNYRKEPGNAFDYDYSRIVYAMENRFCNNCRNCLTAEPF